MMFFASYPSYSDGVKPLGIEELSIQAMAAAAAVLL
jgi:hypothetical protein